ncbi:replication initiation protein [Erysipelothrix inopinata]|uniref:Replication initiation protein n=1 Tax=Erysipelothrix inopinata TaxID=225084 RepID=A0A7G9S0Z7_9FIRM|nr:RepB family plasmid replication initiator protein [Erysipelothrix inopinata]QNN61522.1 replication initiation protein [Erysipelothrix inopinata]
MNDFNLTNKMVQGNDMIQAINKLDRTTFKIFEMAVSCIDTNAPKQEVFLSKVDIFNFFDMDNSNRFTRMEQSFQRLSQQGIVLELPNEEKALINVTSRLQWGSVIIMT